MSDHPPGEQEEEAEEAAAAAANHDNADAPTEGTRWAMPLLGLIAVAAVVIAVLLIVLVARDDDADTAVTTIAEVATTTASTDVTTTPITSEAVTATIVTTTPATSAPTTDTNTTAATTTSGPVTSAPASADIAIWPHPGSTTRYDDPVEAAVGFAEEFAGFTDVTAGEFQAGDSRSGEVELTTGPSGPVTLVLVRQVGPDDAWSVIAAVSPNILVDEPEALATISGPLNIAGTSTAFEGTVQVRLYADGVDEPLVDSFVTGGSFGELAPFAGTFEWDGKASGGAVLLLQSESPEDGSVIEASALRVFLVGTN